MNCDLLYWILGIFIGAVMLALGIGYPAIMTHKQFNPKTNERNNDDNRHF